MANLSYGRPDMITDTTTGRRHRRSSFSALRWVSFLLTFAVAAASVLVHADAEPLPPRSPSLQQDVYFKIVEAIVEFSRRDMRPHIDADKLGLFDSIRVEIARTDQDFFRARAVIENGESKVIFSAGFLLALRGLDDATGYFLIHDLDAFGPYIEYYAKYIRYADAQIKLQKMPLRYKHFCDYPPGRKQACAKKVATDLVERSQVAVKYYTIAFILAHELGHHLLGHVKKRSGDTYEREKAADEFAMQLFVKANMPWEASIGTFFVMAFLNDKVPFAPNAKKHPHPFCRWVELYVSAPPMTSEQLKPAQQHGFNFTPEGLAKDAANLKKLAKECSSKSTRSP